MKKIFLSFIIGLFHFGAFSQYNFTLKVDSEIGSDKKIYLDIYNNHHIPIQIDSFILKNGQITVTGLVSQPSNFAGIRSSETYPTHFVIDSGENNISVTLSKEKFNHLVINSNSKGNHVFDELNKIADNDIDNYSKPVRGPDGRLHLTEDLIEKIIQDQLKGLESYPNDYGSLIYLYHISKENSNPEDAKNILATLATFKDNVRYSTLGKQLYTEETDLINNKILSKAGSKAKIFNVKDVYNKPFSNSSLSGQNYMIVFSATWCGPCQLELPKLKKLYKIYKNKGLKVIYFNDDDNVKRWKEHVSKNKLDWINVSECLKPIDSKIQRSFGVYSIPTCLIVDKTGTIVYNSDGNDTGIDHIETYIKRVITH